MKRLFAIAMVVAAAAVLGFQTTSLGRASPAATQYGGATYCLDGQTVTTTDAELQSFLNTSIAPPYNGEMTAAEIIPDGIDPDAATEATESFIDQYYGDDDVVTYGHAYGNPELVTDVTYHHVAAGACVTPTQAPEPTRVAYCSVPGNTWADGTPITPGTFLNLLVGQPATDKHYTGAVPAWYVEGVGLTCTLTPTQAALAAASTLRAGGGGDLEAPIPGVPDYGIYPYVPAK